MTIINQTNRTLLLEEINPEKLDLLTLIGDVKGIDSLSDDKIKEINQYLECRSYEEFQEKFAPCIYSFFDANTQSVRYTLKKPENIPENMLTEIPLNQSNDFLKMLFTLMESKKSQGVLNVDFGFENLLDMISPKKVMDDIRQVRKEIRYNYAKYAELEDGDPAKLDVGDKLNELFEEDANNYNNVMAMLPLAIEDIKTRLLLGAGGQQGGGNQIALGMLTMGDKGELKVLEAPKQESTALAMDYPDDELMWNLPSMIEGDPQPTWPGIDKSKNNATKFSGIPIGFRSYSFNPADGGVQWDHASYSAGWWSSTQGVMGEGYCAVVRMWSDNQRFATDSNFIGGVGLTVRCLQD